MHADLRAREGYFLVSKIALEKNFSHQLVNLAMNDIFGCSYKRLILRICSTKENYC